MNRFLFLLLFFISGFSQENSKVFTYAEFLGYVKKYHPNVRQANLEVSKSETQLMAARGAFDPKIEVDFSKKDFANTDYYSILNSSFKIPTWYGIEVKAGFDQSTGVYLNPQEKLPSDGLASVGIQIPLGRGMLINERMANLRTAKLNINLSKQERKLSAIAVLYEASIAYFNWKRQYNEQKIYIEFSKIAQIRVNAVQSLIDAGDRPSIDSLEAVTVLKSRMISLEDATFKLEKSKLELSNFLWLENNIPIELQSDMIPESDLIATIAQTIAPSRLLDEANLTENHPKIIALETKISILEVEQKLKSNALLPQIDLGYYYLSEPIAIDQYDFGNYKIGLNFNFPIFLRKERAGQKLARLKISDAKFGLQLERVVLNNQIKAQQLEINAVKKQLDIYQSLIANNTKLLQSEERLFILGESSLFLINNRENNLVSAQLSEITSQYRYFASHAGLLKIMANPD